MPLFCLFNKCRKKSVKRNVNAGRRAGIELLEERALLSVSPLGLDETAARAEAPYGLQWGTYQFDNQSQQLILDDWAVVCGDTTTYNIDRGKVNQDFYESYGCSLDAYALFPEDWTIDAAAIDTLTLATGGTVDVLDIMPLDAAFLCVCDTSGNIVKAYEYLRGEETVPDETLARQIAYDASLEVGGRVWYYGVQNGQVTKILTGYFLERNFQTAKGFHAYGLVSTYDSVRPTLAIRGTEVKLEPIFDDANPQGIGYAQFQSGYSQVADWLDAKSDSGWSTALVGHSLGGALCQWVAAEYVSQSKSVFSVTTFNSPGVSADYVQKFSENKDYCGAVTHHIVNGDIVSMVGEAYIDGTNYLYSYSRANVLQKHSIPITVDYVCDKSGILYSKPADITRQTIPVADLNSFWFHYTDPWYLGYVAAATLIDHRGASLFFRGTAEQLRKEAGTIVHKFLTIDDQGERTLKIDSIPFKSWKLVNTIIVWNNTTETLDGATTLTSVHGFAVGANVGLSKWSLNAVTVSLSGARVPIGITGLLISDASLALNHIHDDEPLELAGAITIQSIVSVSGSLPGWLGGSRFSGSLITLNGTLLASKDQFYIDGSLKVPHAALADYEAYLVSANGLFGFNWKAGTIQFKGAVNLLCFEIRNGTLTVSWGENPGLEVAGKYDFTIPADWPFFPGKTIVGSYMSFRYFSGNDPDSNYLYIGGALLTVKVGVKYTFNPNRSFRENLQFIIEIFTGPELTREQATLLQKQRREAGLTETGEVLDPIPLYLELAWENDCQNPETVLVRADGLRIAESQFDKYGIYPVYSSTESRNSRTFLVDLDTFDFDNWSFEIDVEGTKIDDPVTETWRNLPESKTVAIETVSRQGNALAIAVRTDTEENTVLKFYLDDNAEHYNGAPIFQSAVSELQNGTIRWTPTDIASGTYYLYVRTEDEQGVPLQAYYNEPIEVVCAPQLVVTDTSGVPTDKTIGWDSMIQGDPALDDCQETFTLVNNGTADADLTNWTFDGLGLDAFWFKAYDDADNQVSIADTVLGIGESLTIRVGLSSGFVGDKVNTFTLYATTNDENLPMLKLSGSVVFVGFAQSDYEVAEIVVLDADYQSGGKSQPSKAAETMTDWDSFYVELWSEGVQEAAAGTKAVATLTWDPTLFYLPADTIDTLILDAPAGVSILAAEPVQNGDGTTSVEIQFIVGERSVETTGSDFFWGAVHFVPNTEDDGGLEDIYAEADSFGAKVKAVAYDLERNNKIDMQDFIAFATLFNQKVEGAENPLVKIADFDGSGTVDMQDFIMFATNFNKKKSEQCAVSEISEQCAVSSVQLNAEADHSNGSSSSLLTPTDVIFAQAADSPAPVWIPDLPRETVEWYWKNLKR